MTKLSSNPIEQSDIEEYLSNYSDFSFELKVLNKFLDLGFECENSGTYEDPITNKSREFDIRALITKGNFRIHLSVECKNIRENFPLVVHCLKRKENESYNELIHTFEPRTQTQQVGPISLPLPSGFIENSRSIKAQNELSLYPKDVFVAKSADQVGRNLNREITSTDGGVYDKISQAVNSCFDLISEAHYLNTENSQNFLTLVCPVLVIPDASLWQVKYSDDGSQIGDPEHINHISYYIGKEWMVGSGFTSLSYKLSHLEIVTFSEIQVFIKKIADDYFILLKNSYQNLAE